MFMESKTERVHRNEHYKEDHYCCSNKQNKTHDDEYDGTPICVLLAVVKYYSQKSVEWIMYRLIIKYNTY